MNRAAGRELSDAEHGRIEAVLSRNMRQLARKDTAAWQRMSREEQLLAGAEAAQGEIRHEAARKVENAQRQVLATARVEQRIRDLQEQYGGESRGHALVRELEQTSTYTDAQRVMAIRRLQELVVAAKPGEDASVGRRIAGFLFNVEDPAMTRDIAVEIFGNGDGRSGNSVAQRGAKAWLSTIEEMRSRFNAAGGDVRQLEYGYVPQPHNVDKIEAAGADAWVAKTLPALDRSRYVRDDGSRMNDVELRELLHGAWTTITTEGLNKVEPGRFRGEGARANKGNDSREIHFKDGEAYLGYMHEFGRGTMYDAMLGHVGAMARSIGLVERYGPNPNAQMRLQIDLAERANGGKLERVGLGAGIFRVDARGLWNIVSGTASTPASEVGASLGSTLRNVQTMGKLAGIVLKALPDLGTFAVTTGFNRLSYWEAIKNLGGVAASAETREFLAMHGLMANGASHALSKWSAENIRQNWSANLANATMKVSLMSAWDDWLTRAYQLTHMGGLGKLAAKKWGDIGEWDRALLERRGIDEQDWAIANAADLAEHHGLKFLTPDSIVATGHERGLELATKVLALIRDESEFAVIKPDLLTKGAQTWNGTQAGTGLGELARSVMLFKSFPIAMITRHWRRMLDAPQVGDGSMPMLANRVAYMGALTTSTMALGAISLQSVQIANGKDPIDMHGEHAPKFWLQALAIGGGGGFYSDLVTRDTNDDRGAWDAVGKTLGGPVIGDLADFYALTKGNIDQALAGKRTHAAAEGIRFARSHLPFINVWYGKAAIDHMGLHALQENLSPGYLSKMKQKAHKDWGQDFFWPPGTGGPARAPNLPAAVGQR